MNARVARRVVLAVAVLASLWSFVPLAPGRTRNPSYPARGITFIFDQQAKVNAMSVWLPGGARGDAAPPEAALRPGGSEVVPGVGCCAVLLGDKPTDVLRALGEPSLRRRFPAIVDLIYEHVWVRVSHHRVFEICTSREDARTPEGIGIGSSRAEAVEAYGKRQEVAEAPNAGGEGRITVPVELRELGSAWHSRAARVVFLALVVSLIVCLFLTSLPRGPAWGIVALACVCGWIGYPTAWALWDVLAGLPVRVALSDLRAWAQSPFARPSVVAALIGLFLGGRLAARARRRSPALVCTFAGLGATVAGTLADGVAVAVQPPPPPILALLWGEPWNPLTRSALPSLTMAICLLLLASQQTRWWQTTRVALGIEVPPLGENAAP